MVRFTKRYKYSRMNGRKKKRRKTQKNKQRKHRKGGMPRIGPFGKQKPLSSKNKPNRGDKVRVKKQIGITPMNREAEVCPPGQVDRSNGFAMCKVEPELVLYDDMTKHGLVGHTLPFFINKIKGGRKRKSRKKSKRKRRKTKRRMKGGSGKGLLASPACSGFNCDLPTNVGEIYTNYPNNNNPFLPDPMSLNRNVRNPISPKPMAGPKGGKSRRRKGRKSMKGGFFWDDWGLGDGLLAYYKGTNAALNTKHLYAGNKPEMSASPSSSTRFTSKTQYRKNYPKCYLMIMKKVQRQLDLT